MFGGTLAWAAPELLLAAPCTNKIDIYSLGVVRGDRPYDREGWRCGGAASACCAAQVQSRRLSCGAEANKASLVTQHQACPPYLLPCVIITQMLWELATKEVPRRGFVQPPPPSEDCPQVG